MAVSWSDSGARTGPHEMGLIANFAAGDDDAALDKLPSIYADVMRLVRDGFTHSEIAGRLGIPAGTVKSRMARAAGTLRAELASLRGGDDGF